MSVSGVRYDINFVIPTERSDEGSRDLSHTFEMTEAGFHQYGESQPLSTSNRPFLQLPL